MWTKSFDDINLIFQKMQTNFHLEEGSLYRGKTKISEGFIFVKSVNLHFYDGSKEAISHCIYMQCDIPPLEMPHIQIKWHAIDERISLYDIDFSEMIDQTNPYDKLKAYKKVKIYDEKAFNKAVKTILKQIIKLRRNEMLQHIGWDFRFNKKGKKKYSFWGNINKFHLTKQGEHIGTYSILQENDKSPFSFSELEDLFDKLDPAVCYPLFLSVVYSMIDPEIFGNKSPLYINICGKYKRDRKKGTYLSPQFIANLFCNFNFDTSKNNQLHGIKHSAHNISVNEDTQMIHDKIILNQDFPVLIYGTKREISGSSKVYRQIKKDMLRIHGINHAKFTPFFITEKQIQKDELICLQIKKPECQANIDIKDTICRLQSFYSNLILNLCNYFLHYYLPVGGPTKVHQNHMKQVKNLYMEKLLPSVLFDENKSNELEAFAATLAILREIDLFDNDNLNPTIDTYASVDFSSFQIKAIKWTRMLLQLPWVEEKPKQDSALSFLHYVANAVKNNFNDLPYFTEVNEDYVFLAYPDCLKHFCTEKGITDCSNKICRFLKEHGHLKTNKNGFFISKQINKTKHNVLAIKRDSLENYGIQTRNTQTDSNFKLSIC